MSNFVTNPWRERNGRTSTFVIAASNSLHKASADYICGGVDDQVEVQKAIDALPDIGGKISFLAGEYRFRDTITCTKPIHLQGEGYNWHTQGGLTRFYPQSALSNSPLFVFEGSWYVGEMSDIGVDGFEAGSHTGRLFELHASGGDFQINRCGWYYCEWDTIIHSIAHNIWISDSFFEVNGNSNLNNAVVDIESGDRNRILNCHFRANNCNYDFRTTAAQNWVVGSDFNGSTQKCLYLGSSVGFISNCFMINLNDVAISIVSSYQNINNCMINTYNTSAVTVGDRTGLVIVANDINSHTELAIDGVGDTTNIIMCNSLRGTGAKLTTGVQGRVCNNTGHTTETSGTATITSANTSIIVTHGLSATPTAGDIMVTPAEALGAATSFWVDTYAADTFVIHVNTAPGSDVTFAWKAVIATA